ncbi:hypothetical protein GCM10007108_03000 [Thermogymnomonas acidicola]|uniref:Uncharacterized protein n=1 Tax=Thermogymnomonas acidicola TaxID=399579 RepID=A0AA37F8U5_9ARCH|nr:hypothetical protein GCM10007108_03000 [Thermogymnomonas acidicola]
MAPVVEVVHASSNPLSALSLGSWQVDQRAVHNWGVNSSAVEQWFNVSWGSNQAEEAGAVDFPYQFMYGNFYMNGKLVAQPISINVHINWAVVGNYPAVSILGAPGDGATPLGAPSGEAISTGIGSGAIGYFSGYPFHIYYRIR